MGKTNGDPKVFHVASHRGRKRAPSEKERKKRSVPHMASYLSFQTDREGDAVISTIALRWIKFTMPEETLSPIVSRALQKYTMLSAVEFWSDEINTRRAPTKSSSVETISPSGDW